MATVTAPAALRIGPADKGRRMTLEQFIEADWEEGWLYELARGVVDVTEIPRPWHGRIVIRVARMFMQYDIDHPGIIDYQAGGGECRRRLPGMVSDRHPDQAIYLDPEPSGPNVWTRWVPHIVVEVVSRGGEQRDFVEKREEYLRVGVREYWILDAVARRMHALVRAGDVWEETIVGESDVYRTVLLPGLEVRPGELLGPDASDDPAAENE
jgi:Uma2 family endonuclease